jgi:hypothetical protein
MGYGIAQLFQTYLECNHPHNESLYASAYPTNATGQSAWLVEQQIRSKTISPNRCSNEAVQIWSNINVSLASGVRRIRLALYFETKVD